MKTVAAMPSYIFTDGTCNTTALHYRPVATLSVQQDPSWPSFLDATILDDTSYADTLLFSSHPASMAGIKLPPYFPTLGY